MKKDIEWLKKEIEEYLEYEGVRDARIALKSVLGYIDQLDKPEVLSQEWIDDNKKDSGAHYIGYYVPIGRLHDLLVPKQDKPVIPQFVAEHIKKWKKSNVSLSYALSTLRDELTLFRGSDDEVKFWLYDPVYGFNNQELYARAWLDDYTVEKEQKYVVRLPMSKNNDNQYAIVDYLGNIWTDALPSKYKITEGEIRGLTKGDILFEHFAVKVEELEE